MSTPARPAQERPSVPAEIKALVAAAFVIAVGFGLITPVLPQFAQSFDVGVTAASVIVSAFAFFRLLFAPAGGALVTRLGERPVYILGLVIVALSTGASAFAQSYWQLLIFRSLGGIGSTMFTVSAMALLVRMAPPLIRGRVSSMYGSAFLIGGVIGPVIGGALGELGMRVPFLVYGVALLLAAALVATMLRGTPLRADPLQGALPPMTVREALGDSAYRAALVSAFANGWTNFGVRVAILPLFAVAVVGETWAAAVALAAGAAATAITLQFSGRIADTLGRRRPILVGLGLSAVGMGAMGLAGGLVGILVLTTVLAAGAGLLNPAQQATVADVVGNGRSGGKVLAAFQMCQDAGGIGGPVVIGAVADLWGWQWAFALSGLVSALAILPWSRARETLAAPAG
ncbi:transmembrane efflux protein (MFS) [Janibacter hoylei PVAS-1]|uniref:MFS transporter n=1 Tax=Janibacter hoylei PVAS-1 TaxID=1210046 RepID=K1E4W0_9MICO|nr:MFS transporter [Janibacter hoylei]EKA60412.1 transmembrane efflux protein (MFS) [Janibacter hoylei PVAS-1]RWU84247.1 MFS transporter [Janibacter hoylei PVAS-1]